MNSCMDRDGRLTNLIALAMPPPVGTREIDEELVVTSTVGADEITESEGSSSAVRAVVAKDCVELVEEDTGTAGLNASSASYTLGCHILTYLLSVKYTAVDVLVELTSDGTIVDVDAKDDTESDE